MRQIFCCFLLFFLLISRCKKTEAPSICDLECKNGGSCADNQCNCPERYSGAFCQNQKTPKRILITKVEINNFPPLRTDGSTWDFGSGPDPFPAIEKNGALIWSSPTYYTNPGVQVLTFTPSSPIQITSVTEKHEFIVYDYDDFGAPQYMGGLIFTPYFSGNKFPDKISVNCAGCTAAGTLYVTYEF